MTKKPTTKSKPTPTESTQKFLKRSITGTTFLTLEHVLHKILLVKLAVLIVLGASAALMLWANGIAASYATALLGSTGGTAFWGICLASALFTISPLVWFLDMRTRAEYSKRAGFANRLSYKAPLYVAMGVLAMLKIGAFAAVLSSVLYLLATMGNTVVIADAWAMSMAPALIALLVFGVTSWYMMQLAKGRDDGRNFNAAISTVGLLLGLVLFVSATISFQGANQSDDFWIQHKGTNDKIFPY